MGHLTMAAMSAMTQSGRPSLKIALWQRIWVIRADGGLLCNAIFLGRGIVQCTIAPYM